jgi:hypothetical protein
MAWKLLRRDKSYNYYLSITSTENIVFWEVRACFTFSRKASYKSLVLDSNKSARDYDLTRQYY